MGKVKDFFKKIKDRLMEMLFPEYLCYVCNRELERPENHICGHCETKMNALRGEGCRKCGMPIPEGNNYCDVCKVRDYVFDVARACYEYNETSSKIVMDLKYRSKKFLVPFMATEMLLKLEDFGVMPDIIIPVPISKKRQKDRGFNQSELLAEEMSSITSGKLEVNNKIIEKVKDSVPQASLSGAERLKNLDGAFKLIDRKSLRGKNILIVDDVFTTGSTVNEVAKEIRKLHPASINVLTFAKTVVNQ